MDALRNTATEILVGLRDRDFTAEAFVQASIDEIERVADRSIFISTCFESAIAAARKIDQARADGRSIGPLAGLPVAIKDNLCTEGILTTAGSEILDKFVPPYSATAVRKLTDAGAIIIGKTNLDEFGMGSTTENDRFGSCQNPWDVTRVAGGSSGGSAAAVAASFCPIALGSDTGGSIRQPSAFCGVTGLKPTYGTVSRFGLIAFASSLDQVGPIARSADDLQLVMSVLAGHDARDATSRCSPNFSGPSSTELAFSGMNIGVCPEQLENADDEVAAHIKNALTVMERDGAVIKEIELPHSRHAVAAYYVIAPCEASSNLSRFDGVRYTRRDPSDTSESAQQMIGQTRTKYFGDEAKRRIMLGTFALSSGYYDQYYLQASKVRALIRQDFKAAFADVDLIVGPTTPKTAFPLGAYAQDPVAMYHADLFTVAANLSGHPAVSLPCGYSSAGLPVGLQIQGRHFEDPQLLSAASRFQLLTDWHAKRPQQ